MKIIFDQIGTWMMIGLFAVAIIVSLWNPFKLSGAKQGLYFVALVTGLICAFYGWVGLLFGVIVSGILYLVDK